MKESIVALEEANLRSLLLNAVLAIGVAVGINAVIFLIAGPENASTQGGRFISPIPGWLIGLVWTCLFVSLGIARWRLNFRGDAARAAKTWIVLLLVFCAAYPIYTVGLQNRLVGFAGNLATIVMAVWTCVTVARLEALAAVAPLMVILWVAFASIAIADQARWLW